MSGGEVICSNRKNLLYLYNSFSKQLKIFITDLKHSDRRQL
jgi:hypothetical protein